MMTVSPGSAVGSGSSCPADVSPLHDEWCWIACTHDPHIETAGPTPTDCPACFDTSLVEVPTTASDLDTAPCPVCDPWSSEFPGMLAHGRWVIGPAKRGERAPWYGDGGPLVNNHTERSGSHPATSPAVRAAESAQEEGT